MNLVSYTKRMKTFTNVYRSFSEIDLILMDAIHLGQFNLMDLDIIKTTFSNNSIFTIFYNDKSIYEAILRTIERQE